MIGHLLALISRALVGGHAHWIGCKPEATARIYFANHSSHLDTIILWAALPPDLRARTHPLAALDYWGQGRLRRLIAIRGLGAVLVERNHHGVCKHDPLDEAHGLLQSGHSLILFPEGTRGTGTLPAPFHAGLYHLAQAHRGAELVPVYLSNPARAYPKGAILPAPILCTASFGTPITVLEGESRLHFLQRAHAAVCAMAPPHANPAEPQS